MSAQTQLQPLAKIGDLIGWEKELLQKGLKETLYLTGEVVKVKENSVIVRLLDPSLISRLKIETDLTIVRHHRYKVLDSCFDGINMEYNELQAVQ